MQISFEICASAIFRKPFENTKLRKNAAEFFTQELRTNICVKRNLYENTGQGEQITAAFVIIICPRPVDLVGDQ